MQNLNRGNVTGFRDGGFVGTLDRRGQQGRSASPMQFDTGQLQKIFDNFNEVFSKSFDNIVSTFSSAAESMNKLANAIENGMIINHQFSGDMTLAFDIRNGDVLKEQIAQAITPKLTDIIATELDRRLDNNNFRSGG